MKLQAEAPAHLKVHEWLAVLLLIGVVGGLAIITSIDKYASAPSKELITVLSQQKEGIEVLVKGAVHYPGIYYLPSQMSLKEFLALAQVLPEANLRRYNLEKPVRKGRLNIPMQPMLTIQLKGAVKNEGSQRVPKGTRVQDLLNMDVINDNADIKALQKKRKLKNGEVIEVPSKMSDSQPIHHQFTTDSPPSQ